ncbi:MAG: hypothetical protein QOF21_529 [Actinomycetota bacterium]
MKSRRIDASVKARLLATVAVAVIVSIGLMPETSPARAETAIERPPDPTSLVVFAFSRPLNSAEAAELHSRLLPLGKAARALNMDYRITPVPSFREPVVGDVALNRFEADSGLSTQVHAALDQFTAGILAEVGPTDRYSAYLAARSSDASPFVVLDVVSDGQIAPAVRTTLTIFESLNHVTHSETTTTFDSTRADPAPQTFVGGTGSDPFEGFGPDLGQWFFHLRKNVVDRDGRRVGSEYEFFSVFDWNTYGQLSALRAAGSEAGFEINVAYKNYTSAPARSGESSFPAGYMSDFPGAYREYVTFDDNSVTYGVGSHEAEKFRWVNETSPNFYESYHVSITIDDASNTYNAANLPPAHTVYVQYDSDMLCGNAGADACFYMNGSGNTMSGYYCAYKTAPAEIAAWDYRSGFGPWHCP